MSTVVNSEREDPRQPSEPSVPGAWLLGRSDPTRPAIVIDGKTKTFGELISKVNQLSNKFTAVGLSRGDVVAGLLLNGAEYYEVTLACTQSGLYFVPINTHLAAPEVEYIVRDSNASVLIAHAELADKVVGRVENAVQHPVIIGSAPANWTSYETFTDVSDNTPADRSLGSLMLYTSGTTGRPKGVRRALVDATPESSLEAYAQYLPTVGIALEQPGRHLLCSPAYHAAPGGTSLIVLHAGHTIYILPGFNAEDVLRSISDNAITTSHMVPTHFQRLLDLPAGIRVGADVSSMQALLHAGAPCPAATKRAMIDWFGPVLWEYLGSTEGHVATCSTQEWLEHPGTIGRPAPGAVVLRGLDGEQAAPGEEGTIYFKAGSFKYLGDPEKTAAARWGDFTTSGDVGRFDDDGYLYVLDRRADLILTGGVNVYPAEVEGALLEHPGVDDVGVIGVADPEWGQKVVAVIQLASGFSGDDGLRTALDQHVREQIAGFKRPREYIFVDDFPRSAAGKVSRAKLRELANGQ